MKFWSILGMQVRHLSLSPRSKSVTFRAEFGAQEMAARFIFVSVSINVARWMVLRAGMDYLKPIFYICCLALL
jgi:hypothetical protein